MEQTMDQVQNMANEDFEILKYITDEIRKDKSRINELTHYAEELKSSFNEEVHRTAMQIIESTSAGINENADGGTLVYRSN